MATGYLEYKEYMPTNTIQATDTGYIGDINLGGPTYA